MTVFKTFLKVLNKNKFIVILYTGILLLFAGVSVQTSEENVNFVATKPKIAIVNEDKLEGITESLVDYLDSKATLVTIEKDKIDDAVFYREVNLVIYIPANYNRNFLNGQDPKIDYKSSGNYESSLGKLLVERYLKTANIYQKNITDEEELIAKIESTLKEEVGVEILSKLDSKSLEKAAYYFNFESYSLLACLIFVITMIMSIFESEKIKKRTLISSTDYKKINRTLLLSNCIYSLTVWLFYLIISFIFVGNIMFTLHGVLYMINSFVFTLTATSLAFLISTLVNNKEAINGVVNVVALGSSFLCGAFVPQALLPKFVLNIAHILPTYYYIDTNNYIISLENFNMESLMPLISNLGIMCLFILIFIILANIITKKKTKLA